jgi:hypothetical protein
MVLDLYVLKCSNMKRKDFLLTTLASLPTMAIAGSFTTGSEPASTSKPFIVDEGKSRFGEEVKFLGVHPNEIQMGSYLFLNIQALAKQVLCYMYICIRMKFLPSLKGNTDL